MAIGLVVLPCQFLTLFFGTVNLYMGVLRGAVPALPPSGPLFSSFADDILTPSQNYTILNFRETRQQRVSSAQKPNYPLAQALPKKALR